MPLVPRFKSTPISPQHLELPNFGNHETGELKAFLDSLFYFKLGKVFRIQILVALVIIGIIVLSGVLIIGKQLYERTFWLVRVQQTTSVTKLVIPNCTASFVFFEGLFALVYYAYVFYHRAIDLHHISPDGRAYFMLFPWIPLFWGAWSGCVGCFYISPGVLNRTTSKDSRFNPRSLIPSPWVLNSLSIGFPLVVTLTIVVIGSIGGQKYRHSARLWHALMSEMKSQSPDAPVTPDQQAAALEVWFHYTKAIWWLSLGFLCFSIFAILLFCFYIIASTYLITTLRDQIAVTRAPVFGGFRSLTKTSQMVPEFTSQLEDRAAEEETRAAQSTFFPTVRNAAARVTVAKSASERAAVLQSALTTIVVMSASILLGILGYIGTALYVTLELYEASIDSPFHLASCFETYNLLVAWLAAVFGSLSFFSIFTKTYGSFFDDKLSPLFKVNRTSRPGEPLRLRLSKNHLKSPPPIHSLRENCTDLKYTFHQEKVNGDEDGSKEGSTHGSTKCNQSLFGSNFQMDQQIQGKSSRISDLEVIASFNPEEISAAAPESIWEGQGIDSFIVSEGSHCQTKESGLKSSSEGSSAHFRREMRGKEELDEGRGSLSSDADFQQQRWDSKKWTRPQIWNAQ